jgi:hypothetical protein
MSVFSTPTEKADYTSATLSPKMDEIRVCRNGVLKQLKALKPNKAAGPEGISPRVLVELADVLAGPLTSLFQNSLDKGAVPADWKSAIVCPVFKKGERYLPQNYRPISLTCVLIKVMEHIITSRLMNFAETQDLFYKHQHGFHKNRSCEKQLIELVADISHNLDQGHETEACVLDFSKAFDKVNHQKLLTKLSNLGVSFQIIAWIDDFLTNRVQKVVVDGEESSEAAVTSGVPQGSVLGPCLFLFYINNLPDNIKSCVRLFADDTIIYNSSANHQTMQDDLLSLEKWEEAWDMEFHPGKCQHILFSRKRNPSNNTYQLHSTNITSTDSIKYLGATVDSKLTWNDHVSNIVTKANATLGFIRRNVLTTSEDVKSTAYKQLVRPVLEYASGAWDSLTQTAEKQLEGVQRRV